MYLLNRVHIDNFLLPKYNVNGIPQMIFLDNESETKTSLIGLNEESMINKSLNALINDEQGLDDLNKVTKFSVIDNERRDITNPRSHS